jgi:hypothetical protein
MRKDKLFLLIFWAIAVFLWGMNIWGNWAERTYDKWKDSGFFWVWFDRLHIARTRENFIRYAKLISWIGIILLSVMSTIILFGT